METTIENITVGEFFTMQDVSKYEIFINTLKGKNFYCGKSCNFNKLTFNEVEVIKMILNNPVLDDLQELFIELYRIKGNKHHSAKEMFLKQSIFDLFKAKTYLEDWIKDVVKKEKMHLSGVEDPKLEMINAGERLAKVSHLLTKISLAKAFSRTPEEIGNWKYSTVFSILVAEKRQNDVIRDYNDIK